VCARAWCTFTLRSEEYAEAYTRALEAQAPPQEGAAAEGGLDLGEFGEALLGPLAPVELLRRPRLRDYVAYLLEVSHCLVARWSLSFSSARCLARSRARSHGVSLVSDSSPSVCLRPSPCLCLHFSP
jgi:hypothetical protein